MSDILLSMTRDLTLPISEAIFPKRFIILNATEDNRRLWEEIMDTCFGNYQAGSFRYVCVNNAFYEEDRNYILLNEKNEPIGSSSTGQHTYNEGYVSMICVAPAYRGRRLSVHLVNYGLFKMKQRGLKSTFLCIEKPNDPAIKTYLKTGFIPLLREEEDSKHWNEVFTRLQIAAPDFDKTICPKEEPHPPRPWPHQLAREKAAILNGDLFLHGLWNRFNMYIVDKTEYIKLEQLISGDEAAYKRYGKIKNGSGTIFTDSDVNPHAFLLMNEEKDTYQYGKSHDGCFEDGLVFLSEIKVKAFD